MQIHIIAIGTRMPAWVEAGYREYAKRMPAQCRLVMHEISAGRRTPGVDLVRIVRTEGERTLAAIPAGARVIALERSGKSIATAQLAQTLEREFASGRDWALMIGGPEGLAPACTAAADDVWSLSALTLAHPVVRVVLAEQLYRAWSISRGLPYHR